jgi:excinuclease ABC subunit C
MIDLATLPHAPGCYLYTDAAGTIIYIGKAKDLKKRVTSYFQKKDHDAKTLALVANIASVSVMITNTETEALLLENNLIKKNQPKYNIDLKDSKRFAYIELTKEKFPRIGIARRTNKDEANYFGPFVSAAHRDDVLWTIKRIFAIRPCRKLPKRACLRYHMGSCMGPCIGAVSEEDYRVQVDRAASLLKGNASELLVTLKTEMAERSANREYERALTLRNQIQAVERLSERQHVDRPRSTDQDVIAYTVSGDTMYLMVFTVEKGRLAGKQEYSFDSREDSFEEFLVLYYADRIPPSELILPYEVDGRSQVILRRKKERACR